jgi:hypothetical protein
MRIAFLLGNVSDWVSIRGSLNPDYPSFGAFGTRTQDIRFAGAVQGFFGVVTMSTAGAALSASSRQAPTKGAPTVNFNLRLRSVAGSLLTTTRNKPVPARRSAFDLLKRDSCNEQDLDGPHLFLRRSIQEIHIWGSQSPLAAVEIARAEQQRSGRGNNRSNKASSRQQKTDRRNDRDRLTLPQFQFPE